jgi:predicted RNase H-like HicB family nuclease
MEYIALLRKEGKSDYGVSFPDFPGCVTAGKTLEEASRNAAEALALHIAGMKEDGEPIPDPSILDYLAKERDTLSGAVPFLVNVQPDETVRVNFTARKSQLDEIDRRAELAGMTSSAYLVYECTRPDVSSSKRTRARQVRKQSR